jgi:hypothetical protein
MKIFILSLLISIYLAGNGIDCTSTSNVLDVDNDSQVLKIVGADDCHDRQLCFLSCNEIFKNDKCSTKRIGFEIGQYKKTFDRSCRRGNSQDPMFSYVKSLKFKGQLLFRSTDKTLTKGLKILKEYLKNIRTFDWCKKDGLYEKRQNQLLKEYENSKKASDRLNRIKNNDLQIL